VRDTRVRSDVTVRGAPLRRASYDRWAFHQRFDALGYVDRPDKPVVGFSRDLCDISSTRSAIVLMRTILRARARARMHARTHASPLIFHHARHLVTVGLLTSLSFHLPALPAPPPIISFHAAARCPRAQTRRMNFNDGL